MPDMPCAAFAEVQRFTNAGSDAAVSNRPLERLAYTRSTRSDAAAFALELTLMVFRLCSADTSRAGNSNITQRFYVIFSKDATT